MSRLVKLISLFIVATALVACGGEHGSKPTTEGKGAPETHDKAASHGGKDPSAGQHAPQAMPVETFVVTAQNIPNIKEYSGRARAYREAEIRPQVSGIIKRRLFEQGEAVKKGAPLYKIDDAEYKVAVDSAQASLESAEASVAVSTAHEKRLAFLVAQDAISRQEYDNAVADLKQAKAAVSLQKAALSSAQINEQRTIIRAPISGVIGRSNVTEGALVSSQQTTALADISQLDPIFFDMTVASADLLEYRAAVQSGELGAINEEEGVPIEILFENGRAYPEKGKVDFVEVRIDESSESVTVRATLPNSTHALLPGMYLRARTTVGTFKDALTIPQMALVRSPTGAQMVYVIGADGMSEARPITTSGSSGDSWIVRSGLKAGDQVIVSGLMMMRPGMPVMAMPPGAANAGGPPNGKPPNGAHPKKQE